MTLPVGFPLVPEKERTPSRMSVISYAPEASGIALSAFADSATPGAATKVTVASGASLTVADGDVVLIYNSTDSKYDGLHIVSAAVTGADATFEIPVAWSTHGVNPAQGQVLNFTNDFIRTGQAQDISGNQTFDTDDWSTIGTEQTTEPNDLTIPISLNVFVDKNLSQAAALLGVTTPSSDTVRVDPSGNNNVTLVMTHYAGRTSTSAVLHYVVYVDVQWDDWGITQSTDDYNQWSYSGNATDVFAKAA